MMPLINGVSYAWSDVILNIMGTSIAGITAIKYDEERKKQNNFGAGSNAVARTYGKKEPSGSITLDVLEVEALQSIAPDGDITLLPPFPIVVCFVNAAGTLVTHKIKTAEFTKNSRDMKEGDMQINIELPLIIGSIDWKA